MSRLQNIHRIKPCYLHLAAMVSLAVLILSTTSQATLVHFESHAWDVASQHIYRNEAPITEPATDVLPGYNGSDFFYVQEIYEDQAIGFSGAAANNPHIFAHVLTYTVTNNQTNYQTTNTTGHTRTFALEPEDLGLPNLTNKKIKLKSDIILDGSLLFIKDSESDIDFSDMDASFEVTVTRENGKKAFKGSVQLKPNAKGKIKVKTKGKIKKKHIDLYTINDSTYRIDFFGKRVSYKTKVKLGEEFSLTTQVISNAVNKGYGTGAEVIFGPGAPTLPAYQEQGIPEPATILLLAGGGLMMFRPNLKRLRIRNRN
jgi:hypothetical protein